MTKRHVPRPPGEEPSIAPVQKEGTIRVQRVYKDEDGESMEGSSEESLGVRVFLTEPAKVGASMKRVINTGNYESYHLEATVFLPCYAEEAEEALKKAAEIAGGFVIAEENALREIIAENRGKA